MRRSTVDHSKRRTRRIVAIYSALLLSGLILRLSRGGPGPGRRGTERSGNWNNATNWTPNTVPNIGTAGNTTTSITDATNNPASVQSTSARRSADLDERRPELG